ncbi:MAG: hypothetical protein J6N45_02415 [Alphaproteobacteria bacterium]|nr:hypothetical protein [Alphaproteobacteria bacterium]
MITNFMDKQSVIDIGEELFKLRRSKHLFLAQVARGTGIPIKSVEGIELGRYIKFGDLRLLLRFYGKKIRITLE